MTGEAVLVPRNGVRWSLACRCRRLTIVPSAAVLAPVRCGACGAVFMCDALALAVQATSPAAWAGVLPTIEDRHDEP